MPILRKKPGFRARALLAAFLVYAFGLLPFLAVSHSHGDEASHASCQLCQVSAQAYEPPDPALATQMETVAGPLPGDDSPRARRALPVPHESRGPPPA